MILRLCLFLILSLSLGSCASLSEDECRVGDWRSIGFEDGTNGRSTAFIAKHQEACADLGITPNQSLWLEGRERGLAVYCTPQNAYLVGRRGLGLQPVCSPQTFAGIQPAYQHGLTYNRILREIERERRDIRAIRHEFAGLSRRGATSKRRTSGSHLRGDVIFIRLRIQRLERQLLRYDSWP